MTKLQIAMLSQAAAEKKAGRYKQALDDVGKILQDEQNHTPLHLMKTAQAIIAKALKGE